MVHGRAEEGPARHPTCKCGEKGKYSVVWDRYYCSKTGDWLEDKCSDEACPYCKICPAKMPVI